MRIHWLINRIKMDYLFESRYDEYRQILEVAKARNYAVVSLLEFHLKREKLEGRRVLTLRHDIDNRNTKGVRLFFDLEREFGVSASYYFRLKTFKMSRLIREILTYGSEVGYHFEEPATLAKREKLCSRQELEMEENRQRIDRIMECNIQTINSRLGSPIRSLCSYNDFYNRWLQVENYVFLSHSVRKRFGICFEAHDPSLRSLFDICIHDAADGPGLWYSGTTPVAAMMDGVPKIYVLTHPRQWHPAPFLNTGENMRRLAQELYYRSRKPLCEERRGLSLQVTVTLENTGEV